MLEAERGDLDAADRWLEVARRTASAGDRASQVDIALGLGMVGARRGDPAAREHLERAVELVDETDATAHRAELRLEVAESLSSEERGEAISLVREGAGPCPCEGSRRRGAAGRGAPRPPSG
jgi:hypothetical protein